MYASNDHKSDWARVGVAIAAVSAVLALIGVLVAHRDASASSARPGSSAAGDPSVPAADGRDSDQPSETTGRIIPPAPTTSTQPPPIADDTKLPAAYFGSWRGVVTQGDQKYPMSMTLHSAGLSSLGGQSHYPTLSCNGNLTLLSGGDDVRVSEAVDSSSCINNVELRLSVDSGVLLYECWHGGNLIATATLRR